MPNKKEIESIEIALLLEGIYQHYGYDFRDYALASLKRRLYKCMQEEKARTLSALQDHVLHDAAAMQRLLNIISIDVTAMFRDPRFYQAFRLKVAPTLRAMPHFRLWHAGCASGEEVFSMAILLEEEGLYDKARLYATDLNESLLQKAKQGVFSLRTMPGYIENYLAAGGKRDFSEYYTAKYDNAFFRPALQKNVVWAQHNLVTDASFNEFDVILCRNVMIYFNNALQDRVHDLLYESLAVGGVLVVGSKESLQFSPRVKDYEAVDEREKIFRKVR